MPSATVRHALPPQVDGALVVRAAPGAKVILPICAVQRDPAHCVGLWAFLDDNVSPSLLTWDTGINLLSGIIEELGHNDIALEFGLTNLTLDA